MNDYLTFRDWAVTRTGIAVEEFEALKLATAFDLYVSRLEAARARGAGDPLETISPLGAGGNSRACTRRSASRLAPTHPKRSPSASLPRSSPRATA